jgi:hypothetical protein
MRSLPWPAMRPATRSIWAAKQAAIHLNAKDIVFHFISVHLFSNLFHSSISFSMLWRMPMLFKLPGRMRRMPKPDLHVQQSANRQRILSPLHGRCDSGSSKLFDGIGGWRRSLWWMRGGFQGGFTKMPLQFRMQYRMSLWNWLQMPRVHHVDVPDDSVVRACKFYVCNFCWRLI